MTIVNLNIYSPRWGHDDVYSVELHKDYMKISQMERIAKLTYAKDSDPKWSGESLNRIMNNNSIYPPEITQDLFKRAWLSWRNGELNDSAVEQELNALAKWINKVTEAKPSSTFWEKHF